MSDVRRICAGPGRRFPRQGTTTMSQADLDFTLPAAGGGEVSLSEISAGRAATVVVFTCNHCPYARAWHDRLQDVARDYADRVGFVQISSNDGTRYPKDSFEMMEERVAADEFATPYLYDESQAVAGGRLRGCTRRVSRPVVARLERRAGAMAAGSARRRARRPPGRPTVDRAHRVLDEMERRKRGTPARDDMGATVTQP
jgi:hypothetical protein